MPNGLNIHDTIQTLFKSNPLGQSSNNAPTPNFAPKVSGNSKKSPATDLYVPVANVVRIMRKGLPPNAKVSDDAKEKVQECVSEFISFITSEANETCQIERRKTVTADDIIGAMAKLGFDNYVEPLKQYLHKYRQSEMPPPSHPKRVVGNMGSEVGPVNITPMTVLPPYAGNPVIQPQTAMFNPTATNSGSYGYGLGTSAGQIVGNPNIQDGSGPSSAIVIGDGSSGDESGDPSGSSQELNFYNLYGPYK